MFRTSQIIYLVVVFFLMRHFKVFNKIDKKIETKNDNIFKTQKIVSPKVIPHDRMIASYDPPRPTMRSTSPPSRPSARWRPRISRAGSSSGLGHAQGGACPSAAQQQSPREAPTTGTG